MLHTRTDNAATSKRHSRRLSGRASKNNLSALRPKRSRQTRSATFQKRLGAPPFGMHRRGVPNNIHGLAHRRACLRAQSCGRIMIKIDPHSHGPSGFADTRLNRCRLTNRLRTHLLLFPNILGVWGQSPQLGETAGRAKPCYDGPTAHSSSTTANSEGTAGQGASSLLITSESRAACK